MYNRCPFFLAVSRYVNFEGQPSATYTLALQRPNGRKALEGFDNTFTCRDAALAKLRSANAFAAQMWADLQAD